MNKHTKGLVLFRKSIVFTPHIHVPGPLSPKDSAELPSDRSVTDSLTDFGDVGDHGDHPMARFAPLTLPRSDA
jgi:hypothetical protein